MIINKPTPNEVKEARANAGLTQKACSEMVHVNLRSWQKWEKVSEHVTP